MSKPAPARPISAVIFDCDGVLVDSEVLALEIEIEVLGEIGLDYDRAEFATRFTGMSMERFYAELEADDGGGAEPFGPAAHEDHGLRRPTWQ